MLETSKQVASDLTKIVRGDVFSDIVHRVAFSSDASIYQIMPNCVVVPRDAGDVVTVMRYARENGVPVVARGAGSGVAGESLCRGIVFDMARYMNNIVSVSDDGDRVTCEPGVVLDDLNNFLTEYGRKIGPDPSSGNRATVGGCVANNATGSHSLEYGYMGDYVERIETVLADGNIVEFTNDFEPGEDGTRVEEIARQCLEVLSGKEEIITKALPETIRNRSGYTIAGICHDGKVDLAKLLGGSEGTLGVFTKITLRTVKLPKVKGLVQFEFDSFEKMAKAVPIIVDSGASACELMDKSVMDMACEALPQYRDIFPEKAAAVLLVEHTGKTEGQIKEKIKKTDSVVGGLAVGRQVVLDAGEQKRLWKSRKDAVPLLGRKRGAKHPIPFIEDVSVGNGRLGEYIGGMQKIAEKYDIAMSFYGHAGDGELHVRPYMDLSDPAEVEKMLAVANEVFSLAWSLGGTISGEHADGLVRAAFIKRQYGDEFYELLCRIKDIFDPDGLMNPGKILSSDADVMIKDLKAERKILGEKVKTDMLFDDQELSFELEQCSGCGVCLSRESDLRICPVFRAVGDELSSSRAKANLLRYWATGQLEEKDFESAEFRKFLDLCVNCKACSLECPSGVDVSKLMIAARVEYVKRKSLRRTEILLSNNKWLSMAGSIFAPIANFVIGLGVFKWFLEWTMGIDERRAMPKFGRGAFLRAGRKYLVACEKIEKPIDRVAYFTDTYANYNDHELGFAVIEVLRANNIEVVLPKQRPAPLPAMVYGDFKTASRDLKYNVKHLVEVVRDGYKVVCSEPSAALALKEELRHYVSGEDAKLVSENTYELMSYLLGLHGEGKLKEAEVSVGGEYVYHNPCHLYALGGGSCIELLEKVCGVKVSELNGGCCGLSGTFGIQKKNYELSDKIAGELKKAIEKAGVKELLTECAACKMQIESMSDCVVTHPAKILARAYDVL
ncbi:MAG: anaerobic glycerol-3-phosphate dehydrogenase subunit C [Planctomycetes bacterium]|nr:anaerobic glycerol-3-phosphate dehydrogenase subunit C [Planctomycetota bacterium]